ncbi:effector-associated constant component EACC1 [Micromonospora sp. CA-244673]|uniref:effector-associated constant component EACC1 n=1 Tax=Micromonospora sp. CA-244673 TaxID=3239958 RepID=UPI003D8F4FD4
MLISIILEGPESAWAATNLVTWLRGHPAVKPYGRAELAPPPEGSMGAVDVVTIVVTQLTAVTNLATAYLQWRHAAKRRITGVRMRVGDVEVDVDDASVLGSAEAIEQLLNRMRAVASTPRGQLREDERLVANDVEQAAARLERIDGTA